MVEIRGWLVDVEEERLWVRCRKVASARGERHMLPRQTKRTEAGLAVWGKEDMEGAGGASRVV